MVRLLGLLAVLVLALPTHALRIAYIGDSITESAPYTGVTRDPVGVLCDLVCGASCTAAGEYTNVTAASPDAVGNGIEYTCASTGDTFRNLGDSGDQQTVEGGTRYGPHVAIGKPVTGSVTAGVCDADADCGAGQVCKDWGGFCSWAYDVLIMAYGHNDNRSGVGPPGQLGAEGETADFVWSGAGAASMQAMARDACELHGMRVILIGVLPYKGATGWTAGRETQRLALNTLMSDFATAGGFLGRCAGRVTYVEATPYVDTVADGEFRLDGSISNDGIHPDTATCADLAQAVKDIAFP